MREEYQGRFAHTATDYEVFGAGQFAGDLPCAQFDPVGLVLRHDVRMECEPPGSGFKHLLCGDDFLT